MKPFTMFREGSITSAGATAAGGASGAAGGAAGAAGLFASAAFTSGIRTAQSPLRSATFSDIVFVSALSDN